MELEMNNFKKISIVGNGLSAWMICVFVAKQLQHTDTKITLYTGVDAEHTADIQSPLPLIHDFFKAINVSPEVLGGSVGFHPKLGNAYLFDNEHPFFHVWGQYGASMGIIESHQVLMRYMQKNASVDLNKLSIGSASVLVGRFKKPAQNPNSIYSTYEFSWSFETEAFLQLLKSMSQNMGVEINKEKIIKLRVDENRGCIFGESNSPYGSDYLINTVPGLVEDEQAFESWFTSLPIRLKSQEKKPNSLSTLVNKIKLLDESSWLCEISHRNIAVRGIYQFLGQDSGNVYVHKKPRSPNYLNFGPAMANMYSPVFSAIDINLIAIKLLLRYFPSPTDTSSVVNEFNRAIQSAFENLRDISQLCLKELFERHNIRNPRIVLSDQAEYKRNLFKHRGRYPVFENEFYKTEWQIWLLLGLGFKCENVEPMTSFVNDQAIKEHIAKVENSVLKELQFAPLAD